ncbi:MAG: putative oxidoreductase YdgJ [Firmicutes bacterium ADurb.Bin300]|jgi:predicted dehydrogenase|nr:MAG: putative oxidoreductase YdgJ [Firmicutes bacterium ADurb.Bin300]HOD02772.1 Gfo/Idh/MocA family oxidoreductase [Clostridiales bacterium]
MINIGIIGFAHSHVIGICEEWLKKPELEIRVAFGWDADKARCALVCKRLGIPEAQELNDILGDDNIQAVFIACETLFHARYAVMSANAKKKIILYKPIALTIEQADSIIDAVNANNIDFTLAWQMRTDPVNLQIKELIDTGNLGRPYYFRRRHCLGMHRNEDFKNTWHCNEKLGGDIFADDSSHAIDWMISLFGMPKSVMCEMSTMHTPEVKNDLGAAMFKYPSGLIAEITFCASCSAAEITTECYFERGTIQHYGGDAVSTRLPHENTPSLKWFTEGEKDWRVSDIPLPGSQWDRICAQAKPLAEFLRNKRPPISTAAQGRDALKAVLACYASAENGRREII